jgi:hypothetical protein
MWNGLKNENWISGNETCEIYMNDEIMKKMEKRPKDNLSLQTETKWKMILKMNLKKVTRSKIMLKII